MAEVPRTLVAFFTTEIDEVKNPDINLDDFGPNDLVLACKTCGKAVKSQKGVTSNFLKHVRVSLLCLYLFH